ncbi:MAG: ATP-binding protein [Myxococcaceae bacterium]|nr:ATP-binding protein [Myxococcaceae bacterium]
MATSALRFSPEVLRRLGEELVPNPDQGILELAKNSYDADASSCEVSLANADVAGGTIVISDDGIGMTPDDITESWLVLGHSSKSEKELTDKQRVPVGDKGLGRLAAMRLGSEVTLRTRPSSRPGKEYSVEINWARYDSAATVESVKLSIDERKTKEKNGTTIEVRNLTSALGRKEVQRLARSLLLLSDPFNDQFGFRPYLRSPQFADLEELVKGAYFSEAEYHLVASLDDLGSPKAKVLDWSGKVLWEASPKDFGESGYSTPACKFDLWTFVLLAKEFTTKQVTMGEVQKWLEVVGGVHLYHGGLRVHPYGDPGHDWLDMNLSRARNPEFRPSTNNSIGKVDIADPTNRLRQKTDRSGFVETDEFRELKRFLKDALDWMAKKRLAAREQRRSLRRTSPPKQVRAAQTALTKAIKKVPSTVRSDIEKAVGTLEALRIKESEALREDLELYRTLSTVGTTVAVFAHESAKPVTQIENMSNELGRRLRKELPKNEGLFSKPLELIQRAAKALRSFAKLPIDLLRREKRRSGQVDVHVAVEGIAALFEPFLADSKIDLQKSLAPERPLIQGSVASLEAVLANLVTNSINAFHSERSVTSKRRVEIATLCSGDTVTLVVRDNGPGIEGIDLEDIWLPGQSTTPGGTGLGLTIVRDSVADLGGRVSAVAHGPLGGAEVTVVLPLLR